MQIELAPGKQLTITFKDCDGDITVEFSDTEIRLFTEWPDSSGRQGVIYSEFYSDIVGVKR